MGNRSTLELETLIVALELADGSEVCFPVADPSLVSFSRSGDGLIEQGAFLEEYLPQQPPEVLARFSCPAGTELSEIEVPLERVDLPRKLQLSEAVTIYCLVIPHGRDFWVVVPSIAHTFHVAQGEELEQAVSSEVQRMVSALELSPSGFAELLPAREHRLEQLTISIERDVQMVPGRARALRKKLAEGRRKKEALAILESVAVALHEQEEVLRGPPLTGREREVEQLDALLGGTERLGVLLFGADLVGKTALFHGWLRRRREERQPKLVFATSGAQLIAGMSGLGQWQERVRRVMEAAAQLDAILYFENLGDLFGDRPDSVVNIARVMHPFLVEGRVRLVGELRPEALDLLESRHVGFISALHRLKLEPLTPEQATEALEQRLRHAARHAPHRPNLDPAAIGPLIDLVDRYLPYQSYPGKAIMLYEELRTVHEQPTGTGEPKRITESDLLETFALRSGIPVFLLRRDQALKLEDVVTYFRRRLVGQEEAVHRVAATICVVKANLQPPGKPLATFLFVGPTGVGKTELARSLARYLFGSEQRMTRFDMSEYMDPAAAQRLIQGTERSEGLLTRQVRQQPFGVLLLDEIEKAHPAVFDLLLQVCGEGRLTDAGGRTAHFNNAMIIMTSNLGVAHRRPVIGLGSAERTDETYYQDQVARAFRPEFVNRLDRIITFDPLTEAQIQEVARLTLQQLGRRRGWTELGLTIDLSERALELLASEGYSEQYGARQMRRELEHRVVTPISYMLARRGGEARGAVVEVRPVEEVTDGSKRVKARDGTTLAEMTAGALRIRLIKGSADRQRHDVRGVPDISELRRRVDRYLQLETVAEVKDQIDFLVTQLTGTEGKRGKGKGQRGDPRRARELAELQTEHHRLSQLWRPVAECRASLEMVEELALTALFEEEDPSPYLQESEASFNQVLHQLFYLLVAQRQHRDRVTMVVQELDGGRALDHWLLPLLERLEQRRWSILAHADGGERTAADRWPAARRWGPPRSIQWIQERLEQPERSSGSLLLRCTGPYAGVALALEAGLHRYSGLSAPGVTASMMVQLIALRTELTDKEWVDARILPRSPASFGEVKRLPAVRAYAGPSGPCELLAGERTAPVPISQYWDRFEEIGAQQLLAYEEHGSRSIDDLYAPLLPHVPQPEVAP